MSFRSSRRKVATLKAYRNWPALILSRAQTAVCEEKQSQRLSCSRSSAGCFVVLREFSVGTETLFKAFLLTCVNLLLK
jgi:hypothetical protein